MKSVQKKLPDGWRWMKFEDVCTINPRRRNGFERSPNALTTFVPMEAIDEKTGTISKYISRPYSEIARGYTYFEEGDILFAKITPCMQNGKASIAKNLIDGVGFGTTEFHVLRPKEGILGEWIYYICRSPEFRKKASDNFEGSAGQQRVPVEFIKKYSVPLPPTIDGQIAIVNQLQHKMAVVEKMRQAALLQQEAAAAMQSSVLGEAFPCKDGARLPQGWRWENLKSITKNIQYGLSISSTKEPIGPRLLRITDIQNGYVDWANVPFCKCSSAEANKYQLEDGDLVFVRTGATTGKSYLICNPENAVFASYLIRLQCKKEIVSPYYLYLFFQSPAYWQLILQDARGGTLSGFNATMLSQMRIPLPPKVGVQHSIAKELEQKISESEKIQRAANRQIEAVEALAGAILREAFDFV